MRLLKTPQRTGDRNTKLAKFIFLPALLSREERTGAEKENEARFREQNVWNWLKKGCWMARQLFWRGPHTDSACNDGRCMF